MSFDSTQCVPEERVSVVDQRGRLAGGRVRRLLVRALLVVGGAFAVTLIAWCIGSASANAAVLPSVPPVPSIPQVVAAATPQLSTPDIPATPALPTPTLRCSCLDGVTKQVHATVDGVGDKVKTTDRVPPAVTPVTDLLVHHVDPEQPSTAPELSAARSIARAVLPVVVSAVPQVFPVPHRHVISGPRALHQGTPTPRDLPRAPLHHTPALPPGQPAGSSDSTAHGTGGVAGGAGNAHLPGAQTIGTGPHLAGPAGTPPLAAAPGAQPGTSPD